MARALSSSLMFLASGVLLLSTADASRVSRKLLQTPISNGICPSFSGNGRNLATCQVTLQQGQQLVFGTIDVPGASCGANSNTFLDVTTPSGAVMGAAENNWQVSVPTPKRSMYALRCSKGTFVAQESGVYVINEGCSATSPSFLTCSGTVAYIINAMPPPPPPSPPPPPQPPLSPAPPLAQVNGCNSYSNYHPSSAVAAFSQPILGTAFAVCKYVTLPPGGTLVFGTSGLPGASSTGPTYVWLTPYNDLTVLQSGGGGGVLRYTAPLNQSYNLYNLYSGCLGFFKAESRAPAPEFCKGKAAYQAQPMPFANAGYPLVATNRFQDYQGMNVPNSPYMLRFSTGTVTNGGTKFFIGTMATQAADRDDTFNIPLLGGALCTGNIYRSGYLNVQCGASATTFAVTEAPMCYYVINYATTQACPQ